MPAPRPRACAAHALRKGPRRQPAVRAMQPWTAAMDRLNTGTGTAARLGIQLRRSALRNPKAVVRNPLFQHTPHRQPPRPPDSRTAGVRAPPRPTPASRPPYLPLPSLHATHALFALVAAWHVTPGPCLGARRARAAADARGIAAVRAARPAARALPHRPRHLLQHRQARRARGVVRVRGERGAGSTRTTRA